MLQFPLQPVSDKKCHCISNATNQESSFQVLQCKNNSHEVYFMMVLLFNQQHLYLYVITSQQYECQWKSDLKCWVSNCSSVCKKTSESAQSLTAGFGQRNASIWLSLKGRSQKQIYKKTWKCNKMQSSKNLDLLQVPIYAVVQLSSMFFSNADKGGNNSWFQQCIWKYLPFPTRTSACSFLKLFYWP